jgi:hypothetical protein
VIERYVFVKLKPEYATEAGRAEVRARSAQLAAIPGVLGVTVGAPADPGAVQAWDLSLVLHFESRAELNAYLHHADHDAYYEGFLQPRLIVIKAWNFTI